MELWKPIYFPGFRTEPDGKDGTCKCGGLKASTTQNAFEDSLHEICAKFVALPSTVNIYT